VRRYAIFATYQLTSARKIRPQLRPCGHAIRKSAATLGEFPGLGHKQLEANIRKLVVPRFGYLIYFKVYADKDEVRILFIQHPKQRRLYRDE
jgi:plasmid stabilization system protein ParE